MPKKKTVARDSLHLVREIPGNVLNSVRYPMKTTSYAGHVPASQEYEDYLMYWFLAVGNDQYIDKPEQVPIVMWLNGGPGYSSLAGLLVENGPFLITRNDTGTIVENANSWNQAAHLLYWDQPVGTGYSYSAETPLHYVKSEEELRKELYTALQRFFDLHPEYRPCPLYIAGESYAGKYVPHIATEIMNNNQSADHPKFINLKGIAVGDGWMKPKLQQKLQIDYAYNMGLVDTNQKARLDALYLKFEKSVDADKMKEAFELGSEIEELILNCAGNPDIYDVRRRSDDSDDLLRSYFNSDAVKEALNVSTLIDWQCVDDVGPVCENLIEDNMKDVTYLLPDLIKNYRVLLYTGTFDMSCGFLGTELILQQVAPYEAWPKQIRKVWVNPLGKTMGYIKSYGNLTQATIPYAGHMVPQDNPVAARNMIIDWVFERTPMLYTPEIDEKRK